MSFVLSSLFACVGEILVEKKRNNGGKEREEKNYWEMSNGVVVIRCVLFSDEKQSAVMLRIASVCVINDKTSEIARIGEANSFEPPCRLG